MPEIIDTVFAKTSSKRSFSMTEYERFGLVFTKTRVYKFGHGCAPPWLCHKVLTYVEYRAVSDVFKNIDLLPPSPPSECVLPPQKRQGGTHSPDGEGGEGSIFWKTPVIGLASYNNLSTGCAFFRSFRGWATRRIVGFFLSDIRTINKISYQTAKANGN